MNAEEQIERLYKIGRRILEIVFIVGILKAWLKRFEGRPWTKGVPNAITKSRLPLEILAIGVYFFAVYRYSPSLSWLGIFLAVSALVLDLWDGFLARLWEVESEEGMIWDPTIDKMFTYPALPGVTYLTFVNYFHGIFSYINLFSVIVLIVLEIDLAGLNWKNLRINKGTKNMKGATNSGKIKFTIECITILTMAIANIPGYNNFLNKIFVNLLFSIGLFLSIIFALKSRSGYKQRLTLAQV